MISFIKSVFKKEDKNVDKIRLAWTLLKPLVANLVLKHRSINGFKIDCINPIYGQELIAKDGTTKKHMSIVFYHKIAEITVTHEEIESMDLKNAYEKLKSIFPAEEANVKKKND